MAYSRKTDRMTHTELYGLDKKTYGRLYARKFPRKCHGGPDSYYSRGKRERQRMAAPEPVIPFDLGLTRRVIYELELQLCDFPGNQEIIDGLEAQIKKNSLNL